MRSVPFFFLLALCLCPALTPAADLSAIRDRVADWTGDAKDAEISDTPVAGVRTVRIGLEVVYMSEDGRYLFAGPLMDLQAQSNLTEDVLARARADLLDQRLIEIPTYHYPAPEPLHEVIIVTDVDCGFCRRLHGNLDAYRTAGLDIRYVMLPRAGRGSPSYVKTVNAACAAQPEAAITDAMNGAEPPAAACAHPIDEHMALARELRIASTPTILLRDGRQLRGLQQPGDLLELLSD